MMRDGVRIAIDVWLPDQVPAGGLPTAMRGTRYWRRALDDGLREVAHLKEAERFIAAGMALVTVDARGTGASFGTWAGAWSVDEVEDLGEVVDWIVKQPWSDGTVGGFGTSYDGTSAHLLAATRRSAVKAIIPRFSSFDALLQTACPGGVPLDWFLYNWDRHNHWLDGHPIAGAALARPVGGRVKAVDGDSDRSLLAEARREHAANVDLSAMAAATICAEDLTVGASLLSEVSPSGRLAEIEASGIPLYLWTSWFDGGYSASALAQMETATNPVHVIIGPWSHGAATPMLGSPFAPQAPMSPTVEEQFELMIGFLLRHQRNPKLPDPQPSRLRYYTLGEETWHDADSWPPPGVAEQTWYLADEGGLVLEPPATGDGRDRYEVDFDATTGPQSRWHSLIGGPPVVYPERAMEDERLLTYTSAPLDRDLEVTGTPAITLHVTSTHEDGNFIVYLENVAPDGTVTYLTEGMLRAIHRKVSTDPPYAVFGPYHTISRDDAEPLLPEILTKLTFSLFPISVLFRRGHRVRIAIAGHDKNLFRRVPAIGQPVVTIERSPTHASYVTLPVTWR
jgi:putative CocE/NonD family hydrolase